MLDEKDTITGLFKYRTYESAKQILQSGELWFSNPKNFNDNFDCSPAILEKHFVFDFTAEHDPYFDEELKQLATLFPGIERVKQLISDPNKVAEMYKAVQVPKIATCTVLCFGLMPTSKLNWAYYGDAGKGICLGFNIEREPFFNEVDSDVTQGTVTYGWPENKINFFTNKIESLKAIFLTKTQEWKHEEEFRMILLYKEGARKFNRSALNTITFGLKVTDAEISSFYQLCLDNGYSDLKYYKIQTDGADLTINRIKWDT